LLWAPFPALAFGDDACSSNALALLQQVDTNGYNIVRQVRDNQFFAQWLLCDTRNYGLGLAVHETFHKLDVEKLSDQTHHAYYITHNEVLKIHPYKLFNRGEIGLYIPVPERDEYFQQYLEGPSGQQDITMVLEELDAYTQGTITDSKLVDYMNENERQSTRDGVATFMYYTELYVKRGREAHPTHWRKMAGDPAYLTLIQRLWQRAEDTLKPIMTEPRLGLRDGAILAKVYSPESLAEMKLLFEAGKRQFRFDPQILLLAQRNNDENSTPQPELTSPASPAEVATPGPEVVPNRAPRTVTVMYNGAPVSLAQLEKMLLDQPDLQNDKQFMKLLRTMRDLEKP